MRYAERLYVESILTTFVELHPLQRDGGYFRPSGEPFGGMGLFFVDSAGLLRESGGEDWREVG